MPPEPRGSFARFVDVRPEERAAVAWSFLAFLLLLTSYYILRPVREAMGVAGGVNKLPWLFSGTFVVTLAAVPLWSAVVARVPRRRLLPLAFRFFALNVLLFFAWMKVAPESPWAARAFWIWLSVFSVLAVAAFWSLMADLWSHDEGRRLFGLIAAGGSAGALLGPGLTALLVGRLGPLPLLLLSAAALELATHAVRRVLALRAGRVVTPAANEPRDNETIGGGALAGVRAVFTSPYLLATALYLLLVTFTGTTGYFLLAQEVAARQLDAVARTSFYARLDLVNNLLTLVIQGVLVGALLTRYGVKAALFLLPPLAAASFAASALWPTLLVVAAFHILRRAVGLGIGNPTRDLLFTVVGREEKYKAKAFIDTVAYRGGDIVGAWAFAAVTGLGLGTRVVSWLAVALTLPWMGVAIWLVRRHREAIVSSK